MSLSREVKLHPGPPRQSEAPITELPSEETLGDRSAALGELMQSLRNQSVPVLAWKASPRSPETFSGRGDTDLLVAAEQHARAVEVIKECRFRRIPSAAWRAQPSVSDWFKIDPLTGSLIHVQLYEKLVLGSAFEPQVEVPGAERLFERMSEGSSHEISAADAAVLRLCRAALARPWSQGRGTRALLTEATELAEQVPLRELETAAALFPPDTSRIILESFSKAKLSGLRRHLLKTHRSPLRAGGESLSSRLVAGMARWNRETLRLPILCRRKLSRPAPVIAVIGSDGSGKSTVARMLSGRLHEKLDAQFCYFGTGDGPASWYRKPLVILRDLRSWAMRRAPSPGNPGGSRDKVPGLAKALWAVTVGIERSAKMKRVRRAAAAGWIVVTDRYPQIEIPGIHDGPRLNDWIELGGIRSFLSRWENKVYRSLAEQRPSLVLHLAVSPETAQQRRPLEAGDELVRRVEVAARLRFGDCDRVVIDADQPLDQVFGAALNAAFSRIAHEH